MYIGICAGICYVEARERASSPLKQLAQLVGGPAAADAVRLGERLHRLHQDIVGYNERLVGYKERLFSVPLSTVGWARRLAAAAMKKNR